MNTKVREIFTQAAVMASEDREAYLVEACGGDAELRLEVQRLLIDAERADLFFGDEIDDSTLAADGSGQTSGKKATPPSGATQFLPDAATPAAEPVTEKEGDVVGPYKLLQQIGEGGFGTVWMAEQSEPIKRMVALKVIKMGMDTREVIARFEAERQALAMMDHPHIARVLDAGATNRGRPFFVMELVKGIPITEYCDESGLGTHARLALFGDVCAAINHAHQKGIIHRDIKPSNVMVTLYADKPVVKVIDFGIAKATQSKLTDKTLFTRFEQFIGTPVYMSPEQAALSAVDIDTRSDIYALGVLLYVLLVGKPPFDSNSLVSAGYDEMRRIIREVEPVKPSSRLGTIVGEERTLLAKARHVEETKLNKLVEADLDWIVMKAIDKDRALRYETANAFAQDIVRFLADEPVTATPPSVVYKFRKFARRNKAVLGVVAAMVALLLAGFTATSWQAVRATAEAVRANDAEKMAQQRLRESEETREEAEAVSRFLTGMFESARPGDKDGGREVKVVDILDSAVSSLKNQLEDQPGRRATLQATIGATYDALGLNREAIPLLEEVHDDYERRYGPKYPGLVHLKRRLARCYKNVDRKDDEVKMLEELLDLRRKLNDPTVLFLETMQDLEASYDQAGFTEKAIGMRRDYLQTCEEWLARCRKDFGLEHPETIKAISTVGIAYAKRGRMEEAVALSEESLTLRRKVSGLEHPETLEAIWFLASYYHETGRKEEALALSEELLELCRKAHGPEAERTYWAMMPLARSYLDAGRTEEALVQFEQVLKWRSEFYGPEHRLTLYARWTLANGYFQVGRKEEALALREESLALRRKLLGPEHVQTLTAMASLATSYADADRADDAAKLRAELETLKAKP